MPEATGITASQVRDYDSHRTGHAAIPGAEYSGCTSMSSASVLI